MGIVHEGPGGSYVVDETVLFGGIDDPLRMKRGGTTVYFETDVSGSVRRLRAPGGGDLGGYRYSAFGKTLEDTTTVTQSLRWKGRWASDVAGGLYDVRARQWSPQLGAFLTIDELAFHDASSTLWGWPSQNPVTNSDWTGHHVVPADRFKGLSDQAEWLYAQSDQLADSAKSDWAAGNRGMAIAKAYGAINSWGLGNGLATAPAIVDTIAIAGGDGGGPCRASGLRTAQEAGISPHDAARIAAVAKKTGVRVTVVGSRASGTASPWSDWDYIIEGNAKARSYARWQLPRGLSGGEYDSRGLGTGIDIFRDPLDPTRPHVHFDP